MNVPEFWELIDKTREASRGDPIVQAGLLVDALVQIPEAEILEYELILRRLMDAAYIGELWDVAYILGCGCGDDGFMDFRAWLISLGKATYEKVLGDPEYLGEIVEVGQETQVFSLLYVPILAYERKTGQEMSVVVWSPVELKGKSAEEPLKLTRFPALTKKFWNRCTGDAQS